MELNGDGNRRGEETDEGNGTYHSLNSLPWGLFLTPLIMKFAR